MNTASDVLTRSLVSHGDGNVFKRRFLELQWKRVGRLV